MVFSDLDLCEETLDKCVYFFRYLKRHKSDEERTTLMVSLLKRNFKGDKLSNYICKELECYGLDTKSKEIVLDYFSELPTFVNAPIQFL